MLTNDEEDGEPNNFLYQGKEWQTQLALNLYDFHASQYDPATGRFLGVDPKAYLMYGWTPYHGMGNNPMLHTDPSGEVLPIILAIAGVVGGGYNVATNWDNIDNFWEGVAIFGAGAFQGVATAAWGPGGAALGGLVTGTTNDLVAQLGNGREWGDIDGGSVFRSALVSSAASYVGAHAGKWASKEFAEPLINHARVNSPALANFINGTIGGAVGGYAGGLTAGFLLTGKVEDAHNYGVQGFKNGLLTGGVNAVASGYTAHKLNDSNVNYWTGRESNVGSNSGGFNALKSEVKKLPNMSQSEIENAIDTKMPSLKKSVGQNGKFVHYKDKNGNIRIRIDPADPNTPFKHIHLYDSKGNSLDINLSIQHRRSMDVHIPILKTD